MKWSWYPVNYVSTSLFASAVKRGFFLSSTHMNPKTSIWSIWYCWWINWWLCFTQKDKQFAREQRFKKNLLYYERDVCGSWWPRALNFQLSKNEKCMCLQTNFFRRMLDIEIVRVCKVLLGGFLYVPLSVYVLFLQIPSFLSV